MSMSVCFLSVGLHISETALVELRQFFYKHVACGRGSILSDGVVIRYVFPVLWMTLYFLIVGSKTRDQRNCCGAVRNGEIW